jgi:hypothetical protein
MLAPNFVYFSDFFWLFFTCDFYNVEMLFSALAGSAFNAFFTKSTIFHIAFCGLNPCCAGEFCESMNYLSCVSPTKTNNLVVH